MQFYVLTELCDEHYRQLCDQLPDPPKLQGEPNRRRGICFYYEAAYVCESESKHFVYLVVEPTLMRLQASSRGGAAKSEAKSEAAKANGAKGGRPPRNPNLFKAANGLLIERIGSAEYKVTCADGSPAANNTDGSDALFKSFVEAEAHAKSWKPFFFQCPSCETRNLRTNQKQIDCAKCGAGVSFSV
jgi:hypothetical protein